MRRLSLVMSCAVALAVTSSVASAATVLYSSSLDDLTGLTILGTTDTAHVSGYDYSADGIPEAPNSVGGAATTGLRMAANVTAGAGNEIAAVTNGLSLAGQYTVQADLWINANGPFPGGGTGSTEFGGIGAGHDGTTLGRNGGSMIYTGEGNSGTDYRLYFNTTSAGGANAPAYAADFPGLEAPAVQGQTGTTQDGSGGFQWMTLLANVDATAGTAEFSLTSATSGNTAIVGSVTGSLSGEASLIYADLFSSVSGNSGQSFGVFDNLIVTAVPEPSSLLLLSFGGVALLRRRR